MHPGPRDEDGNLDPEAPLWVDLHNPEKPLSYAGIYSQLRRIARKAEIKKRVHPHGFRHTRATHLARIMTDAQLREQLGHGPRSHMPAFYSHMAGKDTEEPLLREAGIDPAKPPPSALRPKACGNCGHPNSPASVVCQECNRPLSDAMAFAAYNVRKEGDLLLAEVVRRLIEKAPREVEEVLHDSSIRERLTALERQTSLAQTYGT